MTEKRVFTREQIARLTNLVDQQLMLLEGDTITAYEAESRAIGDRYYPKQRAIEEEASSKRALLQAQERAERLALLNRLLQGAL
jgi:hypothetical protein